MSDPYAGIATPVAADPYAGIATPVSSASASPSGPRRKSTSLGMLEGLIPIARKVAPYSPANLIPGFREANAASLDRMDTRLDERGQTEEPGKLGKFLGQTAGVAALTGSMSPLVGGMVGGAALSEADDAKGLAWDTAIGGLVSRATALGTDAVQIGVRGLLSKAPDIMDLPALQAAKKAAYDAVDASGFTFGKMDVKALADDFAKTVTSSALSKSAKDDAASIINYARGLSKADLSLSQLEKLRGDIYEAMVEKGGDTAKVGEAFRAKIDTMIDASGDSLVRTARDLNARWKKADLVNRQAQSGELRAEKDYGGDFGRKVKDRMFPLIDPANPRGNLRGATKDEKAALTKIATGTKAQNAASVVGGMLDPRRLGGKIMTGITASGGGAGAPFSGGASLLIPVLQTAAGLGLTSASSRIARKNVEDAIRLIAAGGTKQALDRVPTQVSQFAEGLLSKYLRPAAVAASVPASAAARPKKSERR